MSVCACLLLDTLAEELQNVGWTFGNNGTCVDEDTGIDADQYILDGIKFIRNITDDPRDTLKLNCRTGNPDSLEFFCNSACNGIVEFVIDPAYSTATVQFSVKAEQANALVTWVKVEKDGITIISDTSGNVISWTETDVPGGTVYRIIEEYISILRLYYFNVFPRACFEQ